MNRHRRSERILERRKYEEQLRRDKAKRKKTLIAVLSLSLVALMLSFGIFICINKYYESNENIEAVGTAIPIPTATPYIKQPTPIPTQVATFSSMDVSTLTKEELLSLNSAICDSLDTMEEPYEPFLVPVGDWIVGQHIEPGYYSIKPLGGFRPINYMGSNYEFWLQYSLSDETSKGYTHINYIPLVQNAKLSIAHGDVLIGHGNPVFKLSSAKSDKFDVGKYTREELIGLNQLVVKSLNEWTDFYDFYVPLGIWEIGVHVPSGIYDIYLDNPQLYGTIELLSKDWETIKGQHLDSDARNFYALRLEQGQLISVGVGSCLFRKGNENISFGPK